MSFINLLSNDFWSDADITNRTESMVRSVISEKEELVLNRKIQGAAMGQYTLTEEDQAQIQSLSIIAHAAQTSRIEARSDMELLKEIWHVESAINRLKNPELLEDDMLYQQDIQERLDAQNIIDNATQTVLDWISLRNPPEPEPTPIEQNITE